MLCIESYIFRSYLGMTCHWIDPKTRESVLFVGHLRIQGNHTYDVLVKAMETVYLDFDISDKVIYTTIDNGSNFVESFK